jgi:hypothetical protein
MLVEFVFLDLLRFAGQRRGVREDEDCEREDWRLTVPVHI